MVVGKALISVEWIKESKILTAGPEIDTGWYESEDRRSLIGLGRGTTSDFFPIFSTFV